jgi:uncharacterized membrane protein
MTNMIQSIAMLAVGALLTGGVWLIAKRQDRQRGILMIIAALVLLGNILIWTLPIG